MGRVLGSEAYKISRALSKLDARGKRQTLSNLIFHKTPSPFWLLLRVLQGSPLSPHIVQLLGRSADGPLVFPKLSPAYRVFHTSSLEMYKSFILQLIGALACLHSLGIVHRDLRPANLLVCKDSHQLVVCDLEGHWGNREAPEVAFEGGLEDSGWTYQSHIFDLGHCIQCAIYAHNPITRIVEWPVPPPLQAIVDACMYPAPEQRPGLATLRLMVEEIPKN